MKDAPQAPTPPDPTVVAAAQTASNKATAITQSNLNHVNQYTPQGSLTYAQTGTATDGTPMYSATQSLSPDEAAKYAAQNKSEMGMFGLSNNMLGQVQSATAKPLDYSSSTPIQSNVQAGTLNQGVGPAAIQNSIGNVGSAQAMPFGVGGKIQNNIDYSNLNPVSTDFNATSKAAADAAYSQATSRLDPQYKNMENDLSSKLAAQGISENSDAYKREMTNFGNQRTDAYNQANYSAQAAGQAAQQQGYAQSLATNQNTASQDQSQAAYANTAQAQRFGQAATTNTQNNAAQNQNYTQAQGVANLFNTANQQQFLQGQSSAAFQNEAQQQAFAQASQNAALNNSARTQQNSEATYLRELPINEIGAMLGTGSVNMPQQISTPIASMAGTDTAGITANAYNQQLQAYNAQQAAQSSMMGSIFGGLGSLGSAAIMASDIRFKENITPVSKLANGLTMYSYNYRGKPEVQYGVMAQEAAQTVPDAVIANDDGFMFVDYRKVFA